MVQLHPANGLSPISPPPGAHPVFFFTDRARTQLREKQRINRSVSPMPNIPPTPEELDFEERLERALAVSNHLLRETEDLLERLHLASEEVDVAPSETAEYRNASEWMRHYEVANRMNSLWLEPGDEDDILEEIEDLVDLGEGTKLPDATLIALVDTLTSPSPPSPPKPPPEISPWLSGSWNFREYRDADFEAERRAYLNTPRSARASTFTAVDFARLSPSHAASNSMPDATALIPSIKRMYNSAQESLSRSSSPSRWQNLLKLDTKMRW